jgi:hypothetical protein
MSSLNVKAWLGLVFPTVAMGLLLFTVAGTVHYWQGWVFLAVFFAATLLTALYVMKHDPALLRRRFAGGPAAEKGRTQKVIIFLLRSDLSGSWSCRRSAIVWGGCRRRSRP